VAEKPSLSRGAPALSHFKRATPPPVLAAPLRRPALTACADQDKISDFELKLMDIDSEHLGIPDTEYGATVKMPSGELLRIVRDLSSIGDTGAWLRRAAERRPLTRVGTRSDDRGDQGRRQVQHLRRHRRGEHHVQTEHERGEGAWQASRVSRLAPTRIAHASPVQPDDQTTIELTEPVTLTFALRYLNSFCKATPLSGQVTLSLSKELPIVVEYRIADMGYVRYYLAPKIEDEQEADMKAE